MVKRILFRIGIILVCIAFSISAMELVSSQGISPSPEGCNKLATKKSPPQAQASVVLFKPNALLNKFLENHAPHLNTLLKKRKHKEDERVLLLRLSVLTDIRHLTLISEACTSECKFAAMHIHYKNLLEALEEAFRTDPSWINVKETASLVGIDLVNLKIFVQIYARLHKRYIDLMKACKRHSQGKEPVFDYKGTLKKLQKTQSEKLAKFFGFKEKDNSLVAMMYDLLLRQIGKKVSITSKSIEAVLTFTTGESSSED